MHIREKLEIEKVAKLLMTKYVMFSVIFEQVNWAADCSSSTGGSFQPHYSSTMAEWAAIVRGQEYEDFSMDKASRLSKHITDIQNVTI